MHGIVQDVEGWGRWIPDHGRCNVMSRSYYMGHIAKVSGSAPKNVIKVAMLLRWVAYVDGDRMVVDCRSQVQKGKIVQAFTSGALCTVLYLYNFHDRCDVRQMNFDVMMRDTIWGTTSMDYTQLYTQ
jgi:uncharacterized membrane protein